jgi:mannose-6-phosphate isomerase-like protein (cupin superfamily)
MQKINLAEKLEKFSGHWSPKIIAGLNGQHVKLVKALGKFPWHQHEHEDELFFVVRGWFRLEFRDHAKGRASRSVVLRQGEMLVVPRGVEHRPVAEEEVCLLLFEPASTVNTGSAGGAQTVTRPEWI